MNGTSFSVERFEHLPIIGILRGFELDHAVEIVTAAMEGGLTTVEVAMNTEGAAAQITTLIRATNGVMNVGAGTVRSIEQLEEALQAGASYIVTPVIVPDVLKMCAERSVPIFPGAFTPTEVHVAWEAGATMVKLFPANRLGPAYIKDLKAPLNDVRILATGGIRVENIHEYLEAGAEGFGLGSPLFNRERMLARDWQWLTEQIQAFSKALGATDPH